LSSLCTNRIKLASAVKLRTCRLPVVGEMHSESEKGFFAKLKRRNVYKGVFAGAVG